MIKEKTPKYKPPKDGNNVNVIFPFVGMDDLFLSFSTASAGSHSVHSQAQSLTGCRSIVEGPVLAGLDLAVIVQVP